jgi:hypothetical protein
MSKVKRSLHGVSTYRVDKAYHGFTMFNQLLTRWDQLEGRPYSRVFLMDMNGNFVHMWKVPGLIKMHAELLPNGNILCSTDLTPDRPEGFITVGFNATSVMELDWDSNIVWQYDNIMHDYHDRCRLPNGNTIVMINTPISAELAAKVQGGLPGSEVGGHSMAWSHRAGERATDTGHPQMYTITLTEITPEGEKVWEMNLADALDPEWDVISPYTGRSLWPGLNSIELCPDGNLISTSYNLDNVFIWDRATKTVKWRFHNKKKPAQMCSFPHDPHVLDNGNVLFFDNGRFHQAEPNGDPNFFPPDFSRVVEVNPETDEIEWEYRDEMPCDFYSTYISSCQRLPNGNTLIDEGAIGRFFEVNKEKEIVWEYLSPFYSDSKIRHGKTSAVFRCMRYDLDYPGLAGKHFETDSEELRHLNQLYGAEAMRLANQFR